MIEIITWGNNTGSAQFVRLNSIMMPYVCIAGGHSETWESNYCVKIASNKKSTRHQRTVIIRDKQYSC